MPLLMVECSSERDMRGIARYDDLITPGATLPDLMPDGSLTLTIDPRRANAIKASSPWTARPCRNASTTIS